MKRVTLKRWVALSAIDVVEIEVEDDDVDVGHDDFDADSYPWLTFDREIIDSTDSGPWELEET